MKRVKIDATGVKVSLPGYDVTTAGLAGMAFDSDFASIETAIGGTVYITPPYNQKLFNPDGTHYFSWQSPSEAIVQFGRDFGVPPFFSLSRGIYRGIPRDTDPDQYDIARLLQSQWYYLHPAHPGDPIRNDGGVTAIVQSTRAVINTFDYWVASPYPKWDTPIKWLALA